MNRYGKIRSAQVPERVLTKGFVVLIIGNSMSNHLGAQGTVNPLCMCLGETALRRFDAAGRLLLRGGAAPSWDAVWEPLHHHSAQRAGVQGYELCSIMSCAHNPPDQQQ